MYSIYFTFSKFGHECFCHDNNYYIVTYVTERENRFCTHNTNTCRSNKEN